MYMQLHCMNTLHVAGVNGGGGGGFLMGAYTTHITISPSPSP